MPQNLAPLADAGLTWQEIHALLDRHERSAMPRLGALWEYYRNPMRALGARESQRDPSSRNYRLAQERGLPARLLGAGGIGDDRAWKRKEIVIENDIAWRIHTMIDFLLGRPLTIVSNARDPALARRIERTLDAVWEASGGAALLSDAALMAHVYGHVDLVVRAAANSNAPEHADDQAVAAAAAAATRIEAIEPCRAVPVVSRDDYRALDAYLILTRRIERDQARGPTSRPGGPDPAPPSLLRRWLGLADDAHPTHTPRTTLVLEVLGPSRRQVFERDEADRRDQWRLVLDEPALVSPGAPADAPPVAHIQNIAQPLSWEGLGEVEPLIPLQDELNTRLSDRASRVTFQSFKMLLAKGLDGADGVRIGPGQLILTDNPEATIESLGGDAASPSEAAHVQEIREALDKISGVPPLAAGVVRARIGNLSSANALRVTLMGLLSRTARKRLTYGRGIVEASRLVLLALDRAGILPTDPRDRALSIAWPDPLPPDEHDALLAAERKVALGVPRERVLAELGYAGRDAGVM
ncbi:MAG: phage portal protein [Phycisphaeraceae bacterium]|nr:phage portal protein [Phycisphaeraceae bacterium]